MAKYTKRFIRELCVQLRIIRQQKDIPLQQILTDLNFNGQTMKQIEADFSGISAVVSQTAINLWNITAIK